MLVKSFIKQGIEWSPVEIELHLLPGIPQFHFLGLPDMALKESQMRIKSALKLQGYEWPKAKQVIVNMRPNNVKKSSQGLELAIACAFLWETGQIKKSELLPNVPWVYGELGLGGEVYSPPDVFRAELELKNDILLTGGNIKDLPFPTLIMNELKDLQNLVFNPEKKPDPVNLESPLPETYFCKKSAELLSIIATGEHNCLLVGPAGSGKTTWVENLKYLLGDLSPEDLSEVRKWHLAMGWEFQGRPFVSPHHSTPNISMIGGGQPPQPGEITRANHGVLYLDELLEFSSVVKESLREPIVSGKISVSRGGERKEFPANFLLMGTSNLCPCGNLVPGKMSGCRFSLVRCRSYTEKLSGPLADRFSVMAYSNEWTKSKDVSIQEIFQRVKGAQEFILQKRGSRLKNEKLSSVDISKTFDIFLKTGGLPEVVGSRRRGLAMLRVARTIADLDRCEELNISHISRAMKFTVLPFDKLQDIFA